MHRIAKIIESHSQNPFLLYVPSLNSLIGVPKSNRCQLMPSIAVKPLYLTHYTYYLTSNTTRVVQQHQISILISTKYFYIAELVQMPVLIAHYGSHHTEPVFKGIF